MEKKEWKERFMKDFTILLRKDFKIYARPIDNPSNTEGEFNHIGEDLIEFIQQELYKAREEVLEDILSEVENWKTHYLDTSNSEPAQTMQVGLINVIKEKISKLKAKEDEK